MKRSNRRIAAGWRRGWVAVVLSLVAGGGLRAQKPTAAADEGRAARPNFLVLISDDQRWDQMGHARRPIIPGFQTPHIDRIAAEGVSFPNAFVTSPVCAVSRASIVTGRYAASHGMHHFSTPLAPDVLAMSYPALLHDHGYRTGMIGKWGMGTAGTEKVFDVFNAWMDQGAYFHQTPEGKIHNAEWLARRTREFLESSPKDRPFCLTVCFKSPHHPYQPDDRDSGLFKDVVIPQRPSDTAAAYQAIRSAWMDDSLNRWCYFDERRDAATRETFEKNFLRCVTSLDRAVGKILKALKELQLDKDTVVVFLSDNGYLWGEHGLGGKWLLYEESIRVPIVVRIPGLDTTRFGTRPDDLALNIDIAPTILDLAGIPIPSQMDGISLMAPIRGTGKPLREHFFMEHVDVIKVRTPIPDSRGVRTKDWKYIRYVNVQPEAEELYHLKNDPLELDNLIENEGAKAELERMRGLYARYMESWAAGN